MRLKNVRLFIQIGVSVSLLYGILSLATGPDLELFLFPWLNHIREAGPVGAFAQPFSNYTPPYLYLLSAASLLGLTPLATIKLLSIGGTFWLAFAVRRLLLALGSDRHNEAAALSLLLPTTLINGPQLGQCDALWVACCLFAVAAAAEKRTYAMAAWAGLGFAFKAQALFLAPFALAMVIRDRKWAAILMPPLVYLLAVTPAWLAGWPLGHLLTIYARQYDIISMLSTAPNLWAPWAAITNEAPIALIIAACALTALASAWYLWRVPKEPLLPAALLSAIMVPWLLPKMHERYFMLADLLSFCLAYVDRRGVPIFVAVQLGSLLALLAYWTNFAPPNVAGSIAMTVALVATGRLLLTPTDRRGRAQAPGVAA